MVDILEGRVNIEKYNIIHIQFLITIRQFSQALIISMYRYFREKGDRIFTNLQGRLNNVQKTLGQWKIHTKDGVEEQL